MDIVGNWGFGCVIDIVWCVLLLLVYIGTLKLFGSHVVVAGVAAIDVLCSIARSVIRIGRFISLDPLPLPKDFIDLAQSAIAAITF